MKGEITLKILEAIGETFIGITDLFEAFLSAGYGASMGRIDYEFSKIQRDRNRRLNQAEIEKRALQRYYNFIYKLKKDGLIIERAKNNKKFFILTTKGKSRWSFLKARKIKKLPDAQYPKENSSKFTIVIFDIPEKEKRKREWLRAVLKRLGLRMIQKSVFIGKIKIPKQFLDDLRRLKLLEFVEIFEISKSGSLEHIA